MVGGWQLGRVIRTVHVFVVNPYGGPADLKSHLEASVRNVDLVVRSSSLFATLSPNLIRSSVRHRWSQ